ncbi:MAG: ZPR1 zinc finger domain-containing protein [Candidatus Lokiarchaeota archaeon]|nr:ZPR1 zinc finger domain-containing protein [Candidatus Lokiarchaeota archaeon]
MFDTRILYENESCPSCGKRAFSQKVHLYQEPRSKDELLFFVSSCDACNYKKTEIMPVAPSKHVKSNRNIIKINSPKDLETKIYRASTGSIEIPELEVKLEPGIQADLFITNIERVLLKFKESCEFLLRDDPDPDAKAILERRLQDIEECIHAKREFTVILDDPEGFSYILPVNDDYA